MLNPIHVKTPSGENPKSALGGTKSEKASIGRATNGTRIPTEVRVSIRKLDGCGGKSPRRPTRETARMSDPKSIARNPITHKRFERRGGVHSTGGTIACIHVLEFEYWLEASENVQPGLHVWNGAFLTPKDPLSGES